MQKKQIEMWDQKRLILVFLKKNLKRTIVILAP